MDCNGEHELNHRTVTAPPYIIALLQKDYEAVINLLGEKALDIKEEFPFTEEKGIQVHKQMLSLGNILACDKNVPKEVYEKVRGIFDFFRDFQNNPLRKGRWDSITNLTETTEVIGHISEVYPDLLKEALCFGKILPIKFDYYERDFLQKKAYNCFYCQMHKSFGKDFQSSTLLTTLFLLPNIEKVSDISRYGEYISLLQNVYPLYSCNDHDRCCFFISAFVNAAEIINKSRELKCLNNPESKRILAMLKECYLSLEDKDILFSWAVNCSSEEMISSFCFCLDTFVDVEVKLNLLNKDVLNQLLKCMQEKHTEQALTIMNCVTVFENLSLVQNDDEMRDTYSKILLGMIDIGNIEIVIQAVNKGLILRNDIDGIIRLALMGNQLKVIPVLIALRTDPFASPFVKQTATLIKHSLSDKIYK